VVQYRGLEKGTTIEELGIGLAKLVKEKKRTLSELANFWQGSGGGMAKRRGRDADFKGEKD